MRSTSSLAIAAESPDVDILENASVMMPCGECGEYYPVTLREILLAHERLHAGCPGRREDECPPLTHAGLVAEPALRDLLRSWTRILRQVEDAGLELSIRRPRMRH
ncbi:MAG TPA: hypothetical protein VFX12_05420 [Vicinamibacterales bacterium]|nr:hypothetical protein [Vicinamibacterales bacterium]